MKNYRNILTIIRYLFGYFKKLKKIRKHNDRIAIF